MTTIVRVAIGTALAAVLAAVLAWQQSVLARLRSANHVLAEQAATMPSLKAERDRRAEQARLDEANARSARDRAELQRLREEIGTLRKRSTPARPAESAARPTARRASGAVIKLRDAQDVGAATGEDLVQTFAWAMRTGNVKRIQELGDWSAEGARDSAEQFARDVAKGVANGELAPELDSMSFRVLRQVPLDNGDVALVTEARHGNDNHRSAQRIRHVGSEWKLVMGQSGPEEVEVDEELLGD